MSGFQFEDLMSMAESNAMKGKKKIKTSTAPQFNLLGKPKKETPKDKKLSEGVQKFLRKREEEEMRKAIEKRMEKEKLMQLRAQDKKAHKRVNSMLRMTKSANKACMADAKDSFSDALAERGEMQPDEDDYGYTSQFSQDMYKKLLDKYKLVPVNKTTKPKAPAPLPVPQNIATTRHRDVVNNYDYESDVISEKPNDIKEPETGNKKKKKPAPPPVMNFQDLLALANQKAQEPVGVKIKPKSTKPQEKEVWEFGRPMTAKEKAAFLQEKAYKDKLLQSGTVSAAAIAKIKDAANKSSEPSQPAGGSSKVGFKIPSVKKKDAPPTPTVSPASGSKSKDTEMERKVTKNSSSGVSQNIPPSSVKQSPLPNRNPSVSSKPQSQHSQPASTADRSSMKSNPVPEKFRKELNNGIKGKSEHVPEAKPKPLAKPAESSRKPPITQDKSRIQESVQSSRPVPTKSKPMSSMSENSSHPRQVDRQRPRSPPSRMPQQQPRQMQRERSPPRQKMARPRSPPRRPPPPKRRQVIESDEEYDSEMDDFIDDEDADINVSEMIRSITGYDRRRYLDIDDDDIQESSAAEQMREESRSLRIGIQEDLEDMRLEALEKKQKAMMRKKMKR